MGWYKAMKFFKDTTRNINRCKPVTIGSGIILIIILEIILQAQTALATGMHIVGNQLLSVSKWRLKGIKN